MVYVYGRAYKNEEKSNKFKKYYMCININYHNANVLMKIL